MPLWIDRDVYVFANGVLVHARDDEVRVTRSDGTVDRFTVDARVEWLKISPDGRSVLLYRDSGSRIRRWRDGIGVDDFLEAADQRDIVAGGFVSIDGSSVTLAGRDRELRGLGEGDRVLFTADLRSPHAFAPRTFARLPGNRLAMVGSFFSDPLDVAITVDVHALFSDRDAVQKAIRAHAPVRDRAVDVAVGPCASNAAVVLRDPEDEEEPDEDEDDEERGDVEGFAGLYVRDLETGALVERHAYAGRAGSGASLCATTRWIAVEVLGGVDLVGRETGAARFLSNAILDVTTRRLVTVEAGRVIAIASIDADDEAT